jgi:iron complex transport system substrate-binding protein
VYSALITVMRVVSLLPSATEVLCALGVDPVGVTHECDYPPRVRDRPTVVHSTIDATGSSRSVDDRVQEAIEMGGVYALDRDRLRDLDPDVVVTQGLCDVCAVDEAVVRDTIADLGIDADLVATHPHSLADVFDDVERIGRAVDRASAAEELVADLQSSVDAVRERAAGTDAPTMTVLDWLDPVMVSGHWAPDLVSLAGGEFRLADPGERSGPVEWSTLRDADPEVLVAAPCGFSLDRTRESLPELTDRDGWDDLRAVRTGRVFAMDGDQYLNRPGPRLVDTLEHLAWMLHPERFDEPPREAVRRVPTVEPTR